jgi:DNA-binding response OmpR family regulator
MEKAKILVIEDEKDIRLGLKFLLEEFYEVDLADGGVSGIKAAIRNKPDLILLDLNMPDLDGFQTCKALRSEAEFNSTPIVVLTAYNEIKERTKAFELGADDYISKPFDTNELLIRIRRKLDTFYATSKEKVVLADGGNILSCGNLKLDLKNQDATIDTVSISLSALEFKLLTYFVNNTEKLLSRKSIIENVWEGQDVSERIIDPHILALRAKTKGSNYLISSIYGAGYILKSI